MGTELVKKSLKKRAALVIVLGAILFLGAGLIAFAFAVTEDFSGMFFFALIVALLGLFFIGLGVKEGKLSSSGWIKRNPDLLRQADELYGNILYEDKFIVYSNQHVGNRKNPLMIASFDEIIGMYVRKTRYNFLITVHKELVIVTKKGEMSISVYSDKKINELGNLIVPRCPDARLGYSPENLAYFNQVHKEYKARRKMLRK